MKLVTLSIAILLVSAAMAFPQGRQDVVDDGFTWFESFATSELNAQQAQVATGWTLKIWLRVIGDYPTGSGLKVVASKGGRQLFSTRCEVLNYHRAGRDIDESFIRTVECWQGLSATKETGDIDVGVYVVMAQTFQEKLVRTYHLDVRSVARVPSGQQPGLEPPRYVINRHNEAPVAFLFADPAGYVPYFDVAQRPERSDVNKVDLYMSFAPMNTLRTIPLGELACTVDGKKIDFVGPMPYATVVPPSIPRWYREIYQDRIAPKYRAGIPYQDEFRFELIRFRLPLTFGPARDGSRPAFEDHKGMWQCTLGANGVVWRTFRFRVGADGMPEKHPEQRGNVNLGFNSYLVDVDIPPGGSSVVDGRLNGPSTSFFYGQPWTTPEGKSMAARVPKKGNAFPVPSSAPNAVPQ